MVPENIFYLFKSSSSNILAMWAKGFNVSFFKHLKHLLQYQHNLREVKFLLHYFYTKF